TGALRAARRRVARVRCRSRLALGADLVLPLLGKAGAILDGELAVILDQLDGGERRQPLWRVHIAAHRVSVAELGLDALRLFAEQEVDELLGALRVRSAL